jgi:thioredoxin-related protein
MKKLLVLMLAIALFASFTTQETPKKVFIQSIENKIEIGTLAKNRNLVFGFKNILLENLQELNYDVTDSAKDADYSIKVELLNFDVLETNSGFSVFHKSDNETILRVKGYLYNKDGKKIKEFVSVGKSSEISMSTLIISEGGGINQTSVSNVIKKSSETLILNLFKK